KARSSSTRPTTRTSPSSTSSSTSTRSARARTTCCRASSTHTPPSSPPRTANPRPRARSTIAPVTPGLPREVEEFGPYVVYEELGVGGMASVHRAETRGIAGFRRPVALKRMLPHVASSDDFVQAFVREARIASHLRHVNCAQTYELGKVNDIYFIAMELVM